MKKVIQLLKSKINQLDKVENLSKLKLELQEDLHRLEMEYAVLDFKLNRSLKDKNILNSLLSRTSEDLKKVLKKLESKADELNILLNTIPALVYFKDSDLRYQVANKAFLDFSGVTREQVIGKTLNEVFQNYLPVGKYAELEEEVIRDGRFFYNIEEQIEQKNKKIWVHTNIAPVRNDEGKIIGLIGVSWDITSQKKYELELKRAKEMAEEGERIKDRFLTNMSHEIRTPLNGVMGMAEILENSGLDDKQREYLEILMKSGKHLVRLIDDVFEFSALESGSVKFHKDKIHLKDFVKNLGKEVLPQARYKGLKLKLEVDPKVPLVLLGDERYLKDIFENLVSNAIKFTKKGSIRVSVKAVSPKKKEQFRLRVEVIDTGIGIPLNQQNRLFDSFSQLDFSSTKEYEGTGLGLAITRRLVDLMAGEIGVKSTPGKGSTFWVELPFEVEEIVDNDHRDFDNEQVLELLKEFRILLVEDNLINQKITKFNLEKNGCKVDVANNGKEGFEKYKANPYDLILMDIQMPVMDGFEATRQIRAFEKEIAHRHAFVVALTANALESEKQKSKEVEMDGFLGKPFKPIELFQLLHSLIIDV
jgi:PAS domain S-box-containing protein